MCHPQRCRAIPSLSFALPDASRYRIGAPAPAHPGTA